MMTLRAVRDRILTLDNPAKVLRVADVYMQNMAELGDSLFLPPEHAFLKPVLDRYVGDLSGWLGFVREVRDRLPRRSPELEAVQDFQRILDVRMTQIWRRERLNAAVAVALRKGIIANDIKAKTAYADRCTKEWAAMRSAELSQVRTQSVKGRISLTEQETILEKFWKEIDADIANGEVPEP